MSNKLEKSFFFSSKLPSILFVQCTQMGWWRGIANTIHIVTFTPDMSLGFSSLKVRTNWKRKCTQESKIGPKQTHKSTKKSIHGEASS